MTYRSQTIWQPVTPWPQEEAPQPSPFDCSGPSHILAREPHAFKQHQGHRANMPQMALPGSAKYPPPGMMRGPAWRHNDPHPARDAFIVSRRDAGETWAVIAAQVGVSGSRCHEIYKRQTQGIAA